MIPKDTEFEADPGYRRDMAVHEAREAIERLYETIPPQDAHWVATTAIIDADKNYRRRHNNGHS